MEIGIRNTTPEYLAKEKIVYFGTHRRLSSDHNRLQQGCPPAGSGSVAGRGRKNGDSVMFLHLGEDYLINENDIIGIFDLDNTSTSKRTRNFLEKAEKEGGVVPCDDLPKSFILTAEYGMNRVYLTALSPATLEKRLK